MGKVWLRLSTGRVIHLPILEDDVNTADNPIDIPPIVSMNRCFSKYLVYDHPTFGTITFNLNTAGHIGDCNQCGHCCSHLVENCPDPEGNCGWPYNADIDAHACQHLSIKNKNKWPQANNTSCSIYVDILLESKGCAYVPDVINPLWINCGYSS